LRGVNLGVIFIFPGVILLFFSLVIGMEIFTDWELDRIQKKRQKLYGCKYQIFLANGAFYTTDQVYHTYDGLTFTVKGTGRQIYLKDREYGINMSVRKYWKMMDNIELFII
jgi:hypothetical protein